MYEAAKEMLTSALEMWRQMLGELGTSKRDLKQKAELEGQIAAAEATFAKFDAGTYGRCEACGKLMDEETLASFPSVNRHEDCADAVAAAPAPPGVEIHTESDPDDDRPGMRVWIDQESCTGSGLCAARCPSVFRMVNGVAHVTDAGKLYAGPSGLALVPADLTDTVGEVAEACEGQCIFVEEG